MPWRTLLRAALRRSLRDPGGERHPTWRRPDRRADARPGVLAPGFEQRARPVAVAADTSASMSQRLLDAVASEIDALLHQAGVGRVTVVVCDDETTPPQVVRRVASLVLSGGEGTGLRVGIEAVRVREPT